MPKLTILSGPLAGHAFELRMGLNRLGRSGDNDVTIPESSISTHHCELQVAEIGTAVTDLDSTNGTFINGAKVTKGMLQNGDDLTLGEVRVRVDLPDVKIAIPETSTPEPEGAAFLEDGSPACFLHRDVLALYRCIQCENWWCGQCVRDLKRLSGDFLHFCPECSGACVALVESAGTLRKSFLRRVGETLGITRKI